MRTAGVAALVLLISGCGSDVITEDQRANDPYDGPLYVRVTQPDHPDPLLVLAPPERHWSVWETRTPVASGTTLV